MVVRATIRHSIFCMLPGVHNMSFESATIPYDFKLAQLVPLLNMLKMKGQRLHFPNYGPFFNLSFVSKVTKRSACFQIVNYLKLNDLYEIIHSPCTECECWD